MPRNGTIQFLFIISKLKIPFVGSFVFQIVPYAKAHFKNQNILLVLENSKRIKGCKIIYCIKRGGLIQFCE